MGEYLTTLGFRVDIVSSGEKAILAVKSVIVMILMQQSLWIGRCQISMELIQLILSNQVMI